LFLGMRDARVNRPDRALGRAAIAQADGAAGASAKTPASDGRQAANEALFHVKRDRRAQKRQWARTSTLWLS
jgi:hypothetical protein